MNTQLCIVMKNGSEFWVSEPKGKELGNILIDQDKHQFLKINELGGRIINTAEIVEICTVEQMEDRNHLKNKDWQCVEKKWHARGQKCFCKEEKARERRQIEQDREREEANRPLTPAEEKKVKENFAKTRKILEDKGILAKKMHI